MNSKVSKTITAVGLALLGVTASGSPAPRQRFLQNGQQPYVECIPAAGETSLATLPAVREFPTLIILSPAPGQPFPSKEGFYGLADKDGTWWFQKPDGGLLWSFGVDCTGPGEKGKPDNPSYNAAALFPNMKDWVRSTLTDLKDWGFNSLGAWSDDSLFAQDSPPGERLPYFVVLHLGSYDQAPWHDLFGPDAVRYDTAAAAKLIPPLKDDPYLVGYFTDNELGWWDDTIFKSYFSMSAAAPGKQRLIETLRRLYGSMGELKKRWITRADTFGELAHETKIFLKPGTDGIRAVHEWNRVLAVRYYSFMKDLVRRYDPNHMILGDRYCQYYNFETAEAARPYVDVISTNLGADWTDGSYCHFYLPTLHAITGKPIVITEFYFAARENSSHDPNPREYFPTVQTQQERAAGFAACVHHFASIPYVLGAHWFQFYDEPPKGRGDGEAYNMGLVDVYGHPYPDLVKSAASIRPGELHRQVPISYDSLLMPAAPDSPMSSLLHWDREGGFISPSTSRNWADLYVCQDSANVYAGLIAMEYMDESLYQGGHIPEEDRPMLKLKIGRWSGSVRFGGKGQKADCSDSRTDLSDYPGLKTTVILKIPKTICGPIGLGDVSGQLSSHGRGFEMRWSGGSDFGSVHLAHAPLIAFSKSSVGPP